MSIYAQAVATNREEGTPELPSRHWNPPYDWTKQPKPAGLVRWIADHRRLVRVVLIVLDLALVAFLVTGLLAGGNPWYAYLQLFVYATFTVQLGWFVPRQVDRWRQSNG